MKEGENVLVLLPSVRNKLLRQWRGVYKIVQKVGSVDYKIDVDGKLKTFHAYILKRYVDKHDDDDFSRDIVEVPVIDVEDGSSTDDSDLNDSPVHFCHYLKYRKSYCQLPLEETSKCITAFQTPLGPYQFKVMPFGLVNASASFSRLMRELL